MRIAIEAIEALLTRMDEMERKEAVMSSIAWSFAMSMGQTMARQERIFNDDDPTYGNWSHDRRAETNKRLEGRLEAYAAIVGWAAAQANPDFLPSGQEVLSRILSSDAPPQAVGSDDVQALAEEMGLSELEIKQLLAHNKERYKAEQSVQAEAAKLHGSRIWLTVDRALENVEGFDTIDAFDAIRIVERIADKAADYAFNAAASAIRQRRAKRRNTLNSEARQFRDIESQADNLMDRYRQEVEAETETSPVEALCSSNEVGGRNPEKGGIYGSGQLTIEERQAAEETRALREAEEEEKEENEEV